MRKSWLLTPRLSCAPDHGFTAEGGGGTALLPQHLGAVRSYLFDFVLNGQLHPAQGRPVPLRFHRLRVQIPVQDGLHLFRVPAQIQDTNHEILALHGQLAVVVLQQKGHRKWPVTNVLKSQWRGKKDLDKFLKNEVFNFYCLEFIRHYRIFVEQNHSFSDTRWTPSSSCLTERGNMT